MENVTVHRNRMAIAILSLVGLFVAFYLYAHAAGWMGALQCGLSDCDTVQSSSHARLGPVPVPLIGLVGYAFLLGLALVGLQPSCAGSSWIARLLFLGAAAGWGYSAYLTYLEAWVIRAWCQYCVASAIIMTLILAASLPEVRRSFGEARRTRP